MRTSIELEIAGVSLSYAKNYIGVDFGFLFQDGDETRRRSDAIDYEYYEDHPDEIADLEESEAAFARPLSRVLPRLSLLGSTIQTARAEYEAVIAEALEMSSGEGRELGLLSFDEFCLLAAIR